MANDLNQCNFIGHLGKDPDIRYKTDGSPIATISLAVGSSWTDKSSGQKQERTEWVRIVFFDGIAKVASEYLKKGSKIYVSGKWQTRKWRDSNGQDKYTTEVVVQGFGGNMQMLDSKSDGNQNATPQQAQSQPTQIKKEWQAPTIPNPDEFMDDTDIPFN